MTITKSLISTKKGDQGYTTSLGGDKLLKSDIIMECVGSLDELRACLGLIRNTIQDTANLANISSDDNNNKGQPKLNLKNFNVFGLLEIIDWITKMLILIGSACSDPENKNRKLQQYQLTSQHLEIIEKWQRKLEKEITMPKQFILSATTSLSAQIDSSCTLTRKAERRLIQLKAKYSSFQGDVIMAFINRLSDFLFVLARFAEAGNYRVMDYRNINDLKTDIGL